MVVIINIGFILFVRVIIKIITSILEKINNYTNYGHSRKNQSANCWSK